MIYYSYVPAPCNSNGKNKECSYNVLIIIFRYLKFEEEKNDDLSKIKISQVIATFKLCRDYEQYVC